MKYRDSEGNWQDISIKVLDTLPAGAMIDYDGDTVPDGYEEVSSTNILTATYEGNVATGSNIVWNSSVKIGSNISINGSNITIKNLKYIKINADAVVQSGVTGTNVMSVQILKNGVIAYQTLASCVDSNGGQTTLSIGSMLLEISEGDVITVMTTSSSAGAVRRALVTIEGLE